MATAPFSFTTSTAAPAPAPAQPAPGWKLGDLASAGGAVDKYFSGQLQDLGWSGNTFDNSALMGLSSESTGQAPAEVGISQAFKDFGAQKGLSTAGLKGDGESTLRLMQGNNVLGEKTYSTESALDKFADKAVPLAIALGTGGVMGQALGFINPAFNPLEALASGGPDLVGTDMGGGFGAGGAAETAATAAAETAGGSALGGALPEIGTGLTNTLGAGISGTPLASAGGAMDFGSILSGFGDKLGGKLVDVGANALTGALINKLGPSVPKTPDFGQIAQQQGQANVEAAQIQNQMNRVDTTTPFGFQKFKTVPDPSVPGGFRYEQEIGLSPEQQQLYNIQTGNQIQKGQVASGMQGRIADAVAAPFSTAAAGEATKLLDPSQFAAEKEKVTKALYDQMMSLRGPQMEQMRTQLDTKLKNQGLMPGTEAYDQAMKSLLDSQAVETQNYVNQSVAGGGAEQSRLNSMQSQNAGFNNQVRGQDIQEMLLERNQPLSEYNAYMNGVTPTLPQFQPFGMSSVSPAPVMQGATAQYGANADSYNAALAQWQQLLNFGTTVGKP